MAEPKYRQIAEDLRALIEAGDLAPGSQLGTESELREKYNASRNTIRDAVKWLTSHGLVETRPGQGTFVVEKISPFETKLTDDPRTGLGGGEGVVYLASVAAAHRRSTDSSPSVELAPAGDAIMKALRLPPGETVVSRHQQRFIDDIPWSLQTSFYPMSFVERGAVRLIQAADIAEGTVRYLSQILGLEQAGYRDTISVRAPDATETSFFSLPDDGRVAIIQTCRTAYADDGLPMRVTVSVYPADRNRLAFDVGKVPGAQGSSGTDGR